jgi:hypothetical protein
LDVVEGVGQRALRSSGEVAVRVSDVAALMAAAGKRHERGAAGADGSARIDKGRSRAHAGGRRGVVGFDGKGKSI